VVAAEEGGGEAARDGARAIAGGRSPIAVNLEGNLDFIQERA
jgi:hypothetical protein